MLRSDLEALAEQQHLDLEELGLVPKEEAEEVKESGMALGVVKSLAARFRQVPGVQEREQQEIA